MGPPHAVCRRVCAYGHRARASTGSLADMSSNKWFMTSFGCLVHRPAARFRRCGHVSDVSASWCQGSKGDGMCRSYKYQKEAPESRCTKIMHFSIWMQLFFPSSGGTPAETIALQEGETKAVEVNVAENGNYKMCFHASDRGSFNIHVARYLITKPTIASWP